MKLFSRVHHIIFALLISAAMIPVILAPLHVSANSLTHRDDPQKTVTILVLDMSGSMGQNDPAGLRCSAANAFIDLSGPGNFIGVVALDGGNGRGGAHNFELAPEGWSDPVEMSTLQARHALQGKIKANSHNCQPDGSTPTYDALSKALQMLQRTALVKEIPGSVVLLTDGVPAADTTDQINAIQSDLLPQFKNHGWAIDTVALGADGPVPDGTPFHTFHDFLSGLSNATSGKFYDDANGVIKGTPSPLNIAPFFVDIFARHNHRTVQDDIAPTSLGGGTTSRNFSVTNFVDHLDAVIVKDQPGTTVSLQDPNGHPITAQAGIFISSDPHYVIYSIDNPQPGTWTLNVTGTGQFLMKSLTVSSLGLSALKVSQGNLIATAKSALALGQPITISANLTSHGQAVTDSAFTLSGHIQYNGASNAYEQDFSMDSRQSPGTYVGGLTIPENAPPGSYDIQVSAATVSLAHPIATQLFSVRIEHFPEPSFLSPQTQLATNDIVAGTAVRWDPILQLLYGTNFAPIEWLSHWPLQGLPGGQKAVLPGQVVLNQQPYGNAQVLADTLLPGAKDTTPVQIVNDGGGRFHALVPATANGNYTITFHTSGTFADSHGDFGTIQRPVHIAVIGASWWQEIFAWGVTLFYLLILISILNLSKFAVAAHPFGGWVVSSDGEVGGTFQFKRARRGLRQWFFQPSLIFSQQANMPGGLCFRFKRGGGIEVRPDGSASADWQKGDGSSLQAMFQEVRELRYHPGGYEDEYDDVEPATYLIKADLQKAYADQNEYDEDDRADHRPGKSRQKHDRASFYEDEYDAPRSSRRDQRTRKSRRASDDDYDW